MTNLHIILSLSGTTLGLLVTVITLIYRGIKISKSRKRCEQSMQIANAVLPFIREAEKFPAYSGVEKKAYVMIKASQFAMQNKIKFNEAQVSSRIEELVALTKQVNTKMRARETREIEQEIKEVSSSWL